MTTFSTVTFDAELLCGSKQKFASERKEFLPRTGPEHGMDLYLSQFRYVTPPFPFRYDLETCTAEESSVVAAACPVLVVNRGIVTRPFLVIEL